MRARKEYNDRHVSPLVNPGVTVSYRVAINKAVTGYQMTYGIYTSFKEAQEALSYASNVNTIDHFTIEHILIPLLDSVLQ